MAHIEKYTASATGHMFAHYDRAHPGKESNIDSTRTCLNYNLAEINQPLSQLDFLKKRLSEIKVLKRADVNVMCDWIVTAPENLTDGEYEKFFREVYDFLNNRYGKENVISSYVHMDETTPHLHYAFVPVVTDKKKGILKLSAKERITKSDLKSFHNDLTKRMTEVFGRDIGILNGATVNGSLTPKQMKKLEEDMQNFQTVPIEEETSLLTKVIGKEKVVVKRSELDRVNKIATEAQYVLENQTALNTQSAEIRKRADSTLTSAEEKEEQIITAAESKAAELVTKAENKAAEIISKAESEMQETFESKEKEISETLAMAKMRDSAAEENRAKSFEHERELSERLEALGRREQGCQETAERLERESKDIEHQKAELLRQTNSPHAFYMAQLNNMQAAYDNLKKKSNRQQNENDSLTSDLARANKDKEWQAEEIADLNHRLEVKEANRKKELEAYRKYYSEKTDKDVKTVSDEYEKKLAAKDSVIEQLKDSIKSAYRIVRNICVAVATLICGKDETAKYRTEFGASASNLLTAIFNYGEKEANKAGFDSFGRDIQNSYCILKPIQDELDLIEPKTSERHISEYER